MNYKRNARYFKKEPLPPPKSIFGGIAAVALLVVFNVISIGQVIILGIIIGVFLGILKFMTPSDAEIDAQLGSLATDIKERALKKLGIDEEEVSIAPPLFLKGYAFWKSRLGDVANMKLYDVRGKDGVWRSPECVLTAWFFSEDQIHYYARTVSLVSDSYKESTEEFFYKDVVSVKTDTLEKPWIDPKTGRESKDYKTRWLAFMLRNSGGETTECACDSSDEADRCVSAMRNLIKQKKLAQ